MALSNNPRLLLAKLRAGDYAHAGEEEAIDIVIRQLEKKLSFNQPLRILDAGCGLGGTAAYFAKKISVDITGIDIDENALEHAKKTHSPIQFNLCDILNVSKYFSESFNLIYLFNVYYALTDQLEALKELHRVSLPGTILVIFDYIKCNEQHTFFMKDLADKTMRPVSLDLLKEYLIASGWKLLETVNLNSEYQRWYDHFIKRLISSKKELLMTFTEEAYEKVFSTFSVLLTALRNDTLGGAAIYAQALPLA